MQPIYIGDEKNQGIRALSISYDSKFLLALGYGQGYNMFLRHYRNGNWFVFENYFDKIHHYEVVAVMFFNSSNQCISSDYQKFVIWNIQENQEKAQILQIFITQSMILTFDVSRNDGILAIGYLNSDIQIFEESKGIFSQKQILSQQEQMVSVVKFNYEATFLASASDDSRVIIWQCKNQKWKKHQELITCTQGIFALNWFPVRNQLIYSSRDCKLSLLSAMEQNIYRQIESYIVDQGVIVCGDLSKDGKTYLCGRRSGKLEIFNFSEESQLLLNKTLEYVGQVTDVKISPDQQYFVVSLSCHKYNLLIYEM